MRKVLVWAAAAACLMLATRGSAKDGEIEIPAFNTYNMAPFVTGADTGLAADLVAYLNGRLNGLYRLNLLNVPRERLVKVHLNEPKLFSGVALFLAPQFVDDQEQRRFLWSLPLFDDWNVLAFLGPKRREIQRLQDLAGLRFGAVLGNRYAGLDEMAQAGLLTKENSTSALASLRKVCLARVDFTQMSRVMLNALAPDSGCGEQLAHSVLPQSSSFSRRILIGTGNPVLARRINEAIAAMPCDRQWQAVAAGYGLALAACPSGR